MYNRVQNLNTKLASTVEAALAGDEFCCKDEKQAGISKI